jgi:hypothetical protein
MPKVDNNNLFKDQYSYQFKKAKNIDKTIETLEELKQKFLTVELMQGFQSIEEIMEVIDDEIKELKEAYGIKN